ncbi:hypothetical protein [Allorhizocola rhizosphaerae]|uniref:hypothetical protein n=1 Tax=Allorhizocola rhizosphaerae TaxID=1872709 RepID=UPI000E3D8366|nr:hypothetical protein [Allorhizocola rhizosphaerae]
MSSEVFRFVTVRPPQEVDSLQASSDASIDLGAFPTSLTNTLRVLRGDGGREAMVDAASAFAASESFVDSPRRIDERYLDFAAAVKALPEHQFWTGAGQAFTASFNTNPAAFVATEAFIAFYGRVGDSIVSSMMLSSVPPKVRALLTASARLLFLIRRLAAADRLSRAGFQSAPLVLPHGIFPLPPASTGDLREARAAAAATAREAREAQARLADELTAHRRAVDELLATFNSTGPAGNSGLIFALPDSARLTEATRGVLRDLRLADGPIDVPKTVALLENRAAELARGLHSGNGLAPTGTPGPCPPAPEVGIPADAATVPTGHGDARILGIADLMVLEQELLRYELGEIAHIENVLKSETRTRTFKTSTTTEQTEVTETEVTEEKERDLSSTERFELQTESQSVISSTANKEAGLTIHASYGPSVDATSNFNFSSGSSRQRSDSASASYAREITTKARDRVQTRTLTRRTTSVVKVIEETSQHGFDNKNGNNDIIGVYRFVDKVYQAQIVNYGKRLMLEFTVPEPAAFVRHALTRRPTAGVTLAEPDPPGYCQPDGKTFVPLKATDITRDNYLYWASKYGASDVESPPPSVVIASGAKKSPEQLPSAGDRLIATDLFDVSIADGYLAQSAFINIYGETQAGKHQVIVQIQDQQGTYIEPDNDGGIFPLKLLPTSTVTVTVNSVGFHNWEVLALVFCTLSLEKFQEWQFKTFTSVMNAYRDEKSRFDQAVAEARLQADRGVVGGINPVFNREIEQTELKKGCVALLTGQRFDLFDAVARNVAPFGYPEIDFAEAKAEGAYIQAFEQSFEWNNMTYLFYPYFWGRKDDWPELATLTDDDPLFLRFLRAGAARVQVPVRLGFEQAVLTYLSTGELWGADGAVINADADSPDPVHLSIVDELKSQLGNNNVEGVGTLNVTRHSVNVTGNGTAFTSDDENRRIRIGLKTYVIRTVLDEQTIRLATSYTGDTAQQVGYSLGGKLIGEPWEVKLPTNLVKLDNTPIISSAPTVATPDES